MIIGQQNMTIEKENIMKEQLNKGFEIMLKENRIVNAPDLEDIND
jgi:hypothetical protein